LLSNILLTPFDQEMRRKGYQLTRFADDWVITCKSVAEARAALATATRILERLGVRLNPQKTRIVHIQQGFDFLGYRMVRTSGKSKIPRGIIQRWNPKGLIAYPTRKSIRRFRDRVRMLTRRSAQRKTAALIEELNPTLRGWAEYYKRAHVRTLFHKLDGWIVRRIWSHPFLPVADPGLDPVAQGEAVCRVWLGEPHLSDTLARFSLPFTSVFVKAVCRKSARTV
jgi:hypothetical protein